MILIHGELLPSEKSGDVLASLPALLASTLTQPPPDILMVVDALDRFAARILSGAYAEQLKKWVNAGLLTFEQIQEAAHLLKRDSLLYKLETELGPSFVCGDAYVPNQEGGFRTERLPLGVLFHIAAGNAEALPAYSAAEGLLAGNINLLKLPHADDGLSIALLKELTMLEPQLAPYIYVFDTPSSDLPAMKAMASLADAVVIWGGDEAVKAVRRLAPPGVRIIERGHRISFAYVTSWASNEELAGLASHIFRTNQLFCSSCQGIFYDSGAVEEAEAFAARFMPLLEEAGQRIGFREIGLQAQVTLRREQQRLESLFHPARILWGEYCNITVSDNHRLEPSRMFGDLWIKPLPRALLPEALQPYRGYLQTAGLLCGKKERLSLARLLCRSGVSRVTYGEDMSRLMPGQTHDGRYPLREYSRMVEIAVESDL